MVERVGQAYADDVAYAAVNTYNCDADCVDQLTADWRSVDPVAIAAGCDCDSPLLIDGVSPWESLQFRQLTRVSGEQREILAAHGPQRFPDLQSSTSLATAVQPEHMDHANGGATSHVSWFWPACTVGLLALALYQYKSHVAKRNKDAYEGLL